MEIRHIRYFLAVVELGTITAAAERLRVAQPAISRQLQNLERELGVVLFDRHGPRLTLTHAGSEMVRVASDLITRADRVEMVAKSLGKGSLSRISIAAADTTISEMVAPFTATLGPDDTFVTVETVESDRVHDYVRENFDLGLSATPPPSAGLRWLPLTTVPLRAYVSQLHPWAVDNRRTVTVEELLREDLVLPTETDPTRIILDEAVIAESRSYRAFEQVPSALLAQALAASGRGVGVVTDLPRYGAYPLFVVGDSGEPVCLSIHACWDPEHYAAASIETFVSRLQAFSETEVRDAAWHRFRMR
jgi:DNA-binding transcriptional LysR family regulator